MPANWHRDEYRDYYKEDDFNMGPKNKYGNMWKYHRPVLEDEITCSEDTDSSLEDFVRKSIKEQYKQAFEMIQNAECTNNKFQFIFFW